MKKTLDEIINRSDYKAINDALIDRCMVLARKIRKRMHELELDKVLSYAINTWRCYQGETYEALAVRVYNHDYGLYVYYSLELECSYNLMGDFHCRVSAASGKQYLQFLNDARAILDELDRIETEKVASIQQALDATEDLTKEGSHE